MAIITHLTYEEALALPGQKNIWLDGGRCIVDTAPDLSPPKVRNNRINIKDFGAEGNGDNATPAFKEAVAYAKYIGGGVISVPHGTFKLTSTVLIDSPGIYIEGEGWESRITRSGDFGDTFHFTGNNATGKRLVNCGLSRLYIESTGLTTSGSHIHINGIQKIMLDHIWMQDGYKGITFNGCGGGSHVNRIYLVFVNLFGGTKTGRRYFSFGNAVGNYAHPPCGDLFIADFNLRGYTGNQNIVEYGVEINSADGIWFKNGHIGNTSDANILFNANTTENLSLVYMDNIMSDEGNGYGVYFDGVTTAEYHDIKISNSTFKGAGYGTNGIATSPTCLASWIRFNNCSVEQFKYEGVAINSPTFRGIKFNGCSIHGNAKDINVDSSGYYFAPGVQMITVNGGNSGRNSGQQTSTGLQKYGIEFSSGHSNILINGVDLTGNSIGSTYGASNGVKVTGCHIDPLTVASAGSLSVDVASAIITISGTTNITSINPGINGRMLTLVFQGVLTVVNGNNLKLKGNVTTSVGSTLTLISDGANWIQI